jgi:formylaminopyrimidine deformylase / aminopyrimidine aminohydrolase
MAEPRAHRSVREIPDRSAGRWAAATRSPFLDGVRDGSLPVAAFDTWLAQDALFVADLLRFQSRLLARAPRAAQRVLAGGALALVDELDWFQRLARARGLDLSAAPRPVTTAYAALLDRLDAAPYADAVGCLWVVERVYLDAWSGAAPGAAGYAELVEHWTTPGFAAYVDALAAASDRAGAPDGALVDEVLRLEAAFWAMAVQA